ncbi:hypothetical protein OIDMADRAFT_48184 [Oidiodendron maius Zn]|uniref:Uncharacterized protein n=1 Tax=Oidiodendron maius (strain Zn) TaxID=913774 RepID=A0A0C3HJA8_OIDMZ|nr:hypothetical protein OIDMADRAFT_48184 [Oidiodendron maius Zn]
MAYGIDVPIRDEYDECYFVIYNFGLKESNLALESVDHGVFNVLESASDKNLGGDDFDNQLLNYAIAHFNRENNIDITKGFESMEMLKLEVMKAERALLAEFSAKIEIPARHWFRRPPLTITGTQLRGLNRQLTARTLSLVNSLLENANIEKADIHGIVFTRKSAHIAKIQPSLES